MSRIKPRALIMPFLVLILFFLIIGFSCGDDDDDSSGGGDSQGDGPTTDPGETGCAENADQVCALYFQCTGIHIQNCIDEICDKIGENTFACIESKKSCTGIQGCLPYEGDDDIFDDDDDSTPDDDDDDNNDDDDNDDDDNDTTPDDDDDDDDNDDNDDDDTVDVLLNGDFESRGNSFWNETSGGLYDLIMVQDDAPVDAYSGTWLAWLGGYASAVDHLYQLVTIPDGSTQGTFACYMIIATEETEATANDLFTMKLRNNNGTVDLVTVATLSNTDENLNWALFSYNINVSPYAGQDVQFYMGAVLNDTLNTNFFIDHCSFVID